MSRRDCHRRLGPPRVSTANSAWHQSRVAPFSRVEASGERHGVRRRVHALARRSMPRLRPATRRSPRHQVTERTSNSSTDVLTTGRAVRVVNLDTRLRCLGSLTPSRRADVPRTESPELEPRHAFHHHVVSQRIASNGKTWHDAHLDSQFVVWRNVVRAGRAAQVFADDVALRVEDFEATRDLPAKPAPSRFPVTLPVLRTVRRLLNPYSAWTDGVAFSRLIPARSRPTSCGTGSNVSAAGPSPL